MSEVEILRDIGCKIDQSLEITVMDWKDPRVPYVTGLDIRIQDLDGRVMLNPRGYFATARRSDLVIDIGGGDSFADIYGSRRLIRMFILKYLTLIAGTPLVMAPQTIGPFHKTWSKVLAKFMMRRCAILATRDVQSTQAVRQMGITRDVIEASDVALRLPFERPGPRHADPIKVGINVSGLLMAGGYTGQNEFGLKMDYPNLIRDIIRHFQAHPDGCEVHLVSHVIVAGGRMAAEDDYRASTALAAEFPGTVLAPAFATPSEAKGYIAGMDFFAGARMHACIAAFSSGVPVVPMAYSRKFAGLFGSIGYDNTVDCTTETAPVILDKIKAAYETRGALKLQAETALGLGRSKLSAYEHALQTLMERIGQKAV